MSESKIHNVVIIGSGPAGLTAAIYTSRAELNPILIEGQFGGQLMITSDVENFSGFSKPILGPELMENMRKQAESFGTSFIGNTVVEVDFKQNPFELKLDDDQIIYTRSVIIATGAVAKWLNIPGEDELKGKGVSACATCDGYFFRGKNIVVVGGGDTAFEEATFLTRYAKSVTIIHRRNEFRASQIMIKKARDNPKIQFITNVKITEIKGHNDTIESILLEDVETENLQILKTDGVFVAIGHHPNSELFKDTGLQFDDQGYILRANFTSETCIPGVFVAGDVSDHKYRQAITAAGMGCQAAIDAQHYLEK